MSRDEFDQLDELLRRGLPEPRVNWTRLKARITTALGAEAPDAGAEDEALDEALRTLPSVDDRVNWPRLRGRIVAAVRASTGVAAQHRRYRWIAGATAMLATAAALVLALLPYRTPVGQPAGVVQVLVYAPPAESAGVAYAHIAVAAPAAQPPERFFVIDPVQNPRPSEDTAGYY